MACWAKRSTKVCRGRREGRGDCEPDTLFPGRETEAGQAGLRPASLMNAFSGGLGLGLVGSGQEHESLGKDGVGWCGLWTGLYLKRELRGESLGTSQTWLTLGGGYPPGGKVKMSKHQKAKINN